MLRLKECTNIPGENTFLSVYVDHGFSHHDYVRMYVSNSTFLIATKSHRGWTACVYNCNSIQNHCSEKLLLKQRSLERLPHHCRGLSAEGTEGGENITYKSLSSSLTLFQWWRRGCPWDWHLRTDTPSVAVHNIASIPPWIHRWGRHLLIGTGPWLPLSKGLPNSWTCQQLSS